MSEVTQGYVIIREVEVRPGEFYREYAGPHAATKPAHDDERTGNVCIETDTSDVFIYQAGDPGQWNQIGGENS